LRVRADAKSVKFYHRGVLAPCRNVERVGVKGCRWLASIDSLDPIIATLVLCWWQGGDERIGAGFSTSGCTRFVALRD
jgi:hypothetical protein